MKLLHFFHIILQIEVNTCENDNFRMPNYIFAKAATLMNPYLERTMFTSKSTSNFAMQNPFKVLSTQEETSRYQFFAHFTLKELCMAKSTQALDANRPLARYAARQTPFFWINPVLSKANVHITQRFSNAIIGWPFNKNIF